MRNTPWPPPHEHGGEFIDAVCGQASTEIKTRRGPEHILSPCPIAGCEGDKFAINIETGAWNCPKCGHKGNAYQLARLVGMEPVVSGGGGSVPPVQRRSQTEITARYESEKEYIWRVPDALGYVRSRGLDDETIRRAGLCCREDNRGIFIGFPVWRNEREVATIKYRALAEKRFEWWPAMSAMPLPQIRPLFGDHLEPDAPVILTEGEFDAMALMQAGFKNCVSATAGATRLGPDEAAQIKDSNQIFCCFDNDEAGNKAVGELRHQLGSEKVWRVTFGDFKDANEALLAGWRTEDFERCFAAADNEVPEILVHGKTHATKRLEQILSGQVPESLKSGWENFDQTQHGIRSGELSVLTGHSGEGKTTWAASLALTLAGRGESVGFYSFEQGLDSTQDQILSMLIGWAVIDTPPDRARHVVENEYPESLWIGSEPQKSRVETVVSALRYGRVIYGTRFVVVDHLDFLIDTGPKTTRYEAATAAVKALHNAAIENDIHVLLICQPTTESGRSKTSKRRQVRIEDIAETRAARQLAHNGFVFEADRENKLGFLRVQKARYGPARDDVELRFRFDRYRYWEDGIANETTSRREEKGDPFA